MLNDWCEPCSEEMSLTFMSLSLISHEKIPGCSFFICSIRSSISLVATRGLEPPITPGRMLPVSWYLFRIFDTQPCDTRSCLDITQGLTPAPAISTIFRRMWLGSGRPLINTPPSWFTLPWPRIIKIKRFIFFFNIIYLGIRV